MQCRTEQLSPSQRILMDAQSTVDVPLKRGIAQVEMPAHEGATISVASGVVLGNQIRWEK